MRASRVGQNAGAVGAAAREVLGEPVAAVVELVGSRASIADSAVALRDGGRIGHAGLLANDWEWMADGAPVADVDVRFYNSETLTAAEATPVLQRIVERVEAGRYLPNVWQVFDFDALPDAHDVMEHSRAAGKLVVSSSR